MLMKRSLAALALLAGSLALMAPIAQAAHVSVGIGVGFPGYVAPPPVVVAPPPYYGPPAYYCRAGILSALSAGRRGPRLLVV